MTVKDIARVAGCNDRTVKRMTKKIFPELMKRGKLTIFTEKQAIEIMEQLPKKNMVQHRTNVPSDERLDRLENLVDKIIMSIPEIVTKTVTEVIKVKTVVPQLEYRQKYYSIIAYCNLKGINPSVSEAKEFGWKATRTSNEMGYEIHKVPDERWGQVNSYHVNILDEIFEL